MGVIERLRNSHDINYENLVGDFIHVNDMEFQYIKRLASKKVVELFKQRYVDLGLKTNNCFQDEEIEANEKCNNRYKIHNKYMKNLMRAEVPVAGIEDWKLQGIDDAADGVDDAAGKKPSKPGSGECVDDRNKS